MQPVTFRWVILCTILFSSLKITLFDFHCRFHRINLRLRRRGPSFWHRRWIWNSVNVHEKTHILTLISFLSYAFLLLTYRVSYEKVAYLIKSNILYDMVLMGGVVAPLLSVKRQHAPFKIGLHYPSFHIPWRCVCFLLPSSRIFVVILPCSAASPF